LNNFLEKYHKPLLLNLFVITLAGGSFMLEFRLFGVELYAFRVLLILSLPYLLLTGKLRLYSNKASKYVFFLLIIWLAYACLSILWCIDRTAAYKDIMYLMFAIAILVFLVSIKDGYPEFEKELLTVWVQVFSVIMAIAIWEIYTANHLVSNFTERLYELKPFHNLNFVPVFTFDNPNHYAIYVCLSMALFLSYLMGRQKVVILTFLTAGCCFLIHVLSARFGYIVVFLYALVITAYYYNRHKEIEYGKIWKEAAKLVFIFLFIVIGVFATHKIENVYEKMASEIEIPEDERLPSSVLRKNLVFNGCDYFIESKGMGVGAGNYMSYTRAGKGKHETDGIDSPHSMIVEIFSQYGIIITILFIACFIFFLNVLYRSSRIIAYNKKHMLVLMLIICYAVMSNSNSIFIPLPLNWFMFSLIAVYCDDLLETSPIANVRQN
jgi:teichuronic acid biosynthesis protein TuaE